MASVSFFLDDVQLSQVEECLFVEWIQFRYMKIVGFRFGFRTGRFLYLSAKQYGVFIVRVLGEYGIDVFHGLFVLLHLRQSLGTQQTGFGEVVLEYDGFFVRWAMHIIPSFWPLSAFPSR